MLLTIKDVIAFLCDVISYVLSPPLCYSCRGYIKERDILCSNCIELLQPIAPKMFTLSNSHILTVYAVSRYTEPLRPILFAKYRSDPAVIEKLAELIWQKSVISLVKVDCFIPIPLHWSRVMKRGFNQSELIAQYLSVQSGAPVVEAVSRIRKTQYQVKVEEVDRRCNVKGAFELTKFDFDIAGKHIMLVDDSCTTGSTAIEVARLFVKLNPASINMIVACRAL